MWRAAFSGRSESGSVYGSKKKKSNGRADSIASASSKSRGGGDDPERERKRPSLHRSSRSAYGEDSNGGSFYVTAPSSRTGTLTESAVRALNNPDDDDGEWEDEDRDGRSERKSRRGDSRDRERRRKSRSERERSRSRDRLDRKERRRGESDKRRRSAPVVVDRDEGEGDRGIPAMGSFEQFPGQYAGTVLGSTGVEHTMSGALPSVDPAHQFPGQIPGSFDRPAPEIGVNRADSFGAAADYYLDEGQSVQYQPGVRPSTPNMLVNPDHHLMPASAVPQPAQDTGHGSAAEFYSGRVSPVYTAGLPTQPITSGGSKPSKPSKPSKQSSGSSKISRLTSTAAAAAAAAATVGAFASHHQSPSTSSYPPGSTTNTSKPDYKPPRQKPEPSVSAAGPYYPGPSSPRLPPSAPGGGTTGKYPSHTNSNVPLLAAGAAATAAAGFAAYEIEHHHDQPSRPPSYYGGAEAQSPRPPLGSGNGSFMNGGGGGQGPPPPRPPLTPGGAGSYVNGGGMAQGYHFHEHKGPMTRLKDGLFNLISSPEDVRRMEEYTEYIGVCKYCFDPRSSPYDAPR
ncbi:hypothetical protein M433DRAFT_292426, partial [Acidomyces richmondensis BFW]